MNKEIMAQPPKANLGQPKKSALKSDPRHVLNDFSDQTYPQPATRTDNIENFVPTNSPRYNFDSREQGQAHKVASSLDFASIVGQFNPQPWNKFKEGAHHDGARETRHFEGNAPKTSRVLANITNTIENCNKTTRADYDVSDSGSDVEGMTKYRTLTEGFDPIKHQKAKQSKSNLSAMGLTLRNFRSENDGLGHKISPSPEKTSARARDIAQKNLRNLQMQECRKSKEIGTDKNHSLTERDEGKLSDIENGLTAAYTYENEISRKRGSERDSLSQQGAPQKYEVPGPKRQNEDAKERRKQPIEAATEREPKSRNQKAQLNKTEIIVIRDSEGSSNSYSPGRKLPGRRTHRDKSTKRRSGSKKRREVEQKISELSQRKSYREDYTIELEKELASLRKEVLQLREENEALKKRPSTITLKEREDYEAKILRIERERIDLIQQNADLKEELDDTRKGFQNKLQNFTNIITGLHEEIQILQGQTKNTGENFKSYTEKKAWNDTSSEEYPRFSVKIKPRHSNHSEAFSVANTEASLDIRASVKELENYHKTTSKFIDCLTNLIVECSPPNAYKDGKPGLKEAWRWIKNVVQDYMSIKKKSDSVAENDKIIKLCMESLMVTDRNVIIPALYQIQLQYKRYDQIVSKVKKVHEQATLEELEALLEKQLHVTNYSKVSRN